MSEVKLPIKSRMIRLAMQRLFRAQDYMHHLPSNATAFEIGQANHKLELAFNNLCKKLNMVSDIVEDHVHNCLTRRS